MRKISQDSIDHEHICMKYKLIFWGYKSIIGSILFFWLILVFLGKSFNKFLSDNDHWDQWQKYPKRRRKIITKNRFRSKVLSILSKPIRVIPNKNNSFPENKTTHNKTQQWSNNILNLTATKTQVNPNKRNNSLTNIQPRLYNNKTILIHVVECIEFIVIFVRFEEAVIFATF